MGGLLPDPVTVWVMRLGGPGGVMIVSYSMEVQATGSDEVSRITNGSGSASASCGCTCIIQEP